MLADETADEAGALQAWRRGTDQGAFSLCIRCAVRENCDSCGNNAWLSPSNPPPGGGGERSSERTLQSRGSGGT